MNKIVIGPAGEVIIAGEVNFYQLGSIPTPIGGGVGVWRLDATTFVPNYIDLGDGVVLPNIGARDLVIGKMAMNGTVQWHRSFGAPGAVLDDINLQTYRTQPDGKSILYISVNGPDVDFGFGPMSFPSSNVALLQVAP